MPRRRKQTVLITQSGRVLGTTNEPPEEALQRLQDEGWTVRHDVLHGTLVLTEHADKTRNWLAFAEQSELPLQEEEP